MLPIVSEAASEARLQCYTRKVTCIIFPALYCLSVRSIKQRIHLSLVKIRHGWQYAPFNDFYLHFLHRYSAHQSAPFHIFRCIIVHIMDERLDCGKPLVTGLNSTALVCLYMIQKSIVLSTVRSVNKSLSACLPVLLATKGRYCI